MAVRHRLFFALQPPARHLPGVARHRDRLGELHSKVSNPRLHLTLAITDDYDFYPAEAASDLHAMAAEIIAEPVDVVLSRLNATPRSIALSPGRRSPQLRDLQAALGTRMARAGSLRKDWKFSPHVTLGYRDGASFNRPIDPICWENDDFVLIHSVVDETRHNTLARWPLSWRQGRLL